MSVPFPSPTSLAGSPADVFLGYLEFFRDRLTGKLRVLPAAELRSSRLPSGWTPLELLKHLRHVERRWLEWGFAGADIKDPWADQWDERWHVGPAETLESLLADLDAQAVVSTAIITSHDLADIETFASHVGYLEEGRVQFSEELSSLSDRFREIEITFDAAPPLPRDWPASWLQPESSAAVIRAPSSCRAAARDRS